MASNYTSYPDQSQSRASNQSIGKINLSTYPLPKIPANARLDSVKLTFNVYRTNGHSNGSVYVELEDGSDTRIATISVPKTTNTPGDVDLTNYVSVDTSGNLNPVGYSSINLHGYHANGLFINSTWETTSIKITANYTERYTLTTSVEPTGGGTVTAGDSYLSGSSVSVTATPATGYRFKEWSYTIGGITQTISNTNPLTVNILNDISLVAVFEKIIYDIGYDNLFSLSSWANSICATVSAPSRGTVTYNINTGVITVTTDSTGENYTMYGTSSDAYCITVDPNTEYVFKSDMTVDAGRGQMFVFFYDADGNALSGAIYNNAIQTAPHIGDYPAGGTHSMVFTTPANCTRIGIRVGATDGGCTTATYSNIGLYKKADYEAYIKDYTKVRDPFSIGDTVDLMTPSREGYVFTGWNTKSDGMGTAYTNGNVFPTSNLTLYSQWKVNKIYIGISQAKAIYIGNKPAKAVYIGKTKIYEQ